MRSDELDEVLEMIRKIWPRFVINDEVSNIWWINFRNQHKDRVIETVRDYAAKAKKHTAPTPGIISSIMVAREESEPGFVERTTLPPVNPKAPEFWRDMQEIQKHGTALRRKMELMYKWGGIDEHGNPIATVASNAEYRYDQVQKRWVVDKCGQPEDGFIKKMADEVQKGRLITMPKPQQDDYQPDEEEIPF